MHHRKFSIKISRLFSFFPTTIYDFAKKSRKFSGFTIRYMNLELNFIRSFKQQEICFHLQPTIGG